MAYVTPSILPSVNDAENVRLKDGRLMNGRPFEKTTGESYAAYTFW